MSGITPGRWGEIRPAGEIARAVAALPDLLDAAKKMIGPWNIVGACKHYGMDGPAFWPVMYLTEEGQVIRCPVCGRKVVRQDWREAIRLWNQEERDATPPTAGR